jgi:hypothetical protein
MGTAPCRSSSGLTAYCFSFRSRFHDKLPVPDAHLMGEMPRDTTMVRAGSAGVWVLAIALGAVSA